MITKSSIDLRYCIERCVNLKIGGCAVLCKAEPQCNYKCPFYKPEGCRDWIRVEDRDGIAVVPPEEYYEKQTVKYKRTK